MKDGNYDKVVAFSYQHAIGRYGGWKAGRQ